MATLDLEKIADEQNKFAEARDWAQFHTPKNLSMALTVEASELMEIFQWLNEEEVQNFSSLACSRVLLMTVRSSLCQQ